MKAQNNYTAIWYNMEKEVKRESVSAQDPSMAESKIRSKYHLTQYPGRLLTILDSNGNMVINKMV